MGHKASGQEVLDMDTPRLDTRQFNKVSLFLFQQKCVQYTLRGGYKKNYQSSKDITVTRGNTDWGATYGRKFWIFQEFLS